MTLMLLIALQDAFGDAKKEATKKLEELKTRMLKAGMKGEAADCENIARKMADPTKAMQLRGAASPWPGDDAYETVLQDWSETGKAIAELFKGIENEWARIYGEWFATFPELADGIRHLNRRRKFCKIGPVTQQWSASYGGFMHGRYLDLNRNEASTNGLGAHNEDPKLPGYSNEGADAAKGIVGGGTSRHCMDSWLGSAFHRDPVLDPHVGRVAFGGGRQTFTCKGAGGSTSKPGTKILTFPGDGDTEIPTFFGGEGPNPLPDGMNRAGTMVVVQFLTGQPKKTKIRLLDPENQEVEILLLGKTNPYYFVAKKDLKTQTRYTVEVTGEGGFKFTFGFTTQ